MTMRLRGFAINASDVRGALWSLVTTAAGLGIAIAIWPGTSADGVGPVLVAAVAVAVGDVLLRPVLRLVTRLGVLGALIGGFGGQLLVTWLALTYVPGLRVRSWVDAAAVLVMAGAVMVVGRWLAGANDYEYVLGSVLRRARRLARLRDDPGVGRGADSPPGLLVVQIDGLSRPALDLALQAGITPCLAEWIGRGSHRLESWWAQVPSTTPASQAGLLHGAANAIPAFRWWDRVAGRPVVTNRPGDAAQIEAAISDGRGLLAGGGVAVSTMFSGDAAACALVMSKARAGIGPGRMFAHFFASPFVMVRAVLGTLAETVKELYQGWEQASRRVNPRVSRLGVYPLLRAVSNVILRDMNTSIVAEQLLRGVPVVFVDLVDYDEVAHHAGPLRPESLRSLEGLDRVVRLWQQVAQAAERPYEIVVLSDHGQSLGATYAQVRGETLAERVRALMALPAERVRRSREPRSDAEAWGTVNTALNAFSRSDDAGRTLVGPDRNGRRKDGRERPEAFVTASGNLAMVWFPREAGVLTADEIDERWPALLPGLASDPAIGVIVVRTDRGPVARGSRGMRVLATGEVVGTDPLRAYAPQAAADLLRAAGLPNAGDVIVVSTVDEVGMVHAFEGLVGSHGGLGGAQNEAVLLHPARLGVDDAALADVGGQRMLLGADAVYRQLVAWLGELGLRAQSGTQAGPGEEAK